MAVDGDAAPAYAEVRQAVRRAFESQNRSGGIAVAAFVNGDPVVDVWAGNVDEHTLFHTWSTVKPLTGTCLLLLVERGLVDLNTAVRVIWPELSAAADGRMLVRHVLGHAVGLASVPVPGTAASLLD